MHPSANTAGGRRVTRWTRETIIEKIREWNDRYGEPPCSADWNPSLARWRAQEWRADRYREGFWPSTNAAKRPFGGSFDAAVRAAGLEPHRYRWRAIENSRGCRGCSRSLPPGGSRLFRLRPVRAVGCTGGGARLVTNGPRNRRAVALTFDDGPSGYTDDYLRVLRQGNARATFFVLGQE
ncbi:MAG TPA: polysaccharide deacetylase family protein, partial [Solirubrobacter sp.]|nr:polysaccharide deacetylase family protein [Solirubrobacter sp.]